MSTNTNTKVDKTKTQTRPLRIGMLGNVDAGKSTLLGVLTKLPDGVFDDGRGKARSLILQHPHEHEKGQTSSISKNNKIINGREIQFIDLPGHEGYLKTTTSGMSGNYLDYAMLLISASTSISNNSMTLEHLRLILALKIPIIIILTKIDIAPKKIFDDTIKKIKLLIGEARRHRMCNHLYKIDNDKSYNTVLSLIKSRIVPLIEISNKRGDGIEMLKKFLSEIPQSHDFDRKSIVKKFVVHDTYLVKGIGLVVSGIVVSGCIEQGDILRIGPIHNNIIMIKAKTLHGDYRNSVSKLTVGSSGCIAIRSMNLHTQLRRKDIRRGVWISSEIKLIKRFTAEVNIFKAANVTIQLGYQPVIHCATARQSTKILDIRVKNSNVKLLRCNDNGEVDFEFMYHSEIINVGQRFMFREGKTRGVGIVTKVLTESEINEQQVNIKISKN